MPDPGDAKSLRHSNIRAWLGEHVQHGEILLGCIRHVPTPAADYQLAFIGWRLSTDRPAMWCFFLFRKRDFIPHRRSSRSFAFPPLGGHRKSTSAARSANLNGDTLRDYQQ